MHLFRGGSAVAIGLGVWAERRSENQPIQIHMTGPLNMHTTVNNNPASERYHRTLFRDLRRILVTNGAWQFGDEGAETEAEA